MVEIDMSKLQDIWQQSRNYTNGEVDKMLADKDAEIERLNAQIKMLEEALAYYAQVEGTADCVAGRALEGKDMNDEAEWQRVMKEEVARVFGAKIDEQRAEIERLLADGQKRIEENDRILLANERLRAENERLRAALTAEPPSDAGNIFMRGWRAAQAEARRALEGKT
jgi:hypothetical protein